MDLNFNHIFAGKGMRRFKINYIAIINNLIVWITQLTIVHLPMLPGIDCLLECKNRLRDQARSRARKSHNANPTYTRWGGNGDNGIFKRSVQMN